MQEHKHLNLEHEFVMKCLTPTWQPHPQRAQDAAFWNLVTPPHPPTPKKRQHGRLQRRRTRRPEGIYTYNDIQT